ncbi:hypothetical protein [Gracilimonas tropica]|uniref:hypothetical protein n=1 Tax=Gracilimonas tropica TaxID=454600 RepID=UPI00036F402C|nr:hypothetical protein [Gracilimonas tropica]
MPDINSFRLNYWTSGLMNEMFQVRTIYHYLSNKEHYEEFYSDIWSLLDEDDTDKSDKYWTYLKDQTYDEMRKRTMNNYLVYLSSMIDSLFKEILFLIFSHDKNKIYYLAKMNHIEASDLEKALGIDLKSLITSSEQNIEYFLEGVSENAANICANGKFESVIRRISELTNIDFDENVVEKIQDVQNKRNNILHEMVMYDLELEDFQSRIKSVIDFIMEIIKYFESKKIPINR